LVIENKLPESLSMFFWDCDFALLSWENNRDAIISRLLEAGSWEALLWLRTKLGDRELSRWLVQRKGANLTPRQLRFWEVVLDLPHPEVTHWVVGASTSPWEGRLNR
jgi:hypothetical protein